VKPSPTTVTPYTPKSGAYTGAKKIVGYYPAWATYARNYQVADMPGQKLTHINYAFANIANGKCVLGDSYADTDKAFAGDSWDQGALRGNFNALTKLKAANPGLKTMISIGGWTWSQNFSAAAATDQSRDAFVSSCVSFMKQYKFDGIDVDWEYPVSGGISGGTPADKQNYTALLADFRSALDIQGVKDGGKHYDLSIAAPAGPSIIANIETGKIANYLDWMNLMTYDYHGGWDPITGHNAPMVVGTKDAAKGFSITDTVDAYISGGFPASKLVLGVPFYGRGWENVSSADAGLYQAGANASVGSWEKGVFDYTDIRANYLPTMTRYWDAQAQVPYLYDPVRKLWISYDDPQSMKIKADYVKSKGLGGAMAWEMSGDRDQELLDTLIANL
jgi:chitinase